MSVRDSTTVYTVGMLFRWIGFAALLAGAFLFALMALTYFATRERDWHIRLSWLGIAFVVHAIGSLLADAPLIQRARTGPESASLGLTYVGRGFQCVGIALIAISIFFWTAVFLFFYGTPMPESVYRGFFLSIPIGIYALALGTQMTGDRVASREIKRR